MYVANDLFQLLISSISGLLFLLEHLIFALSIYVKVLTELPHEEIEEYSNAGEEKGC